MASHEEREPVNRAKIGVLGFLTVAVHLWSAWLITAAQASEPAEASIRITSPAPGSVRTAYEIVVRGVFHVPGHAGVRVTVNEVPALLYRDEFALVLMKPTKELTAIVRDADGHTLAQASIPATLEYPLSLGQPPVYLQPAHPTVGTAPFTEKFMLSVHIATDTLRFDARGDGHVDYESHPASDHAMADYEFTYQRPGLYFPTVAADAGATCVGLVRVFAKEELECPIQENWKGFRAALRRGDVEGAVQYFATEKRPTYRTTLNALTIPVKDFERVLGDIHFEKQWSLYRVDYEMSHQEDGTMVSDHVEFGLDVDGVWRLWSL